ncbi:bifunctional protein-disulfide isomerase/oxidoreductase DsbC [Neptunicella marina]|uniref:Thiol:disulfide interchange protein n=1 Tax=Neptunicella marina TaxID=2125989 RepID=A0A8J6M009_9ALTE|nr:bifunctional protein-disulfide isomerase/oxidoreductase DsbC [Neptunicella marina]MBC3766914.1 bifunctional protein-disulfide isomerase/oxidoreductase DsbC [Neptunicella marina]
MKSFKTLLLIALVSCGAIAQDKFAELKTQLSSKLGLDVSSVKAAPAPGLVELTTNHGIFYSTEDGKFLIHGRLFNLTDGIVNETEKSLAAVRKAGLQEFDDAMIRYPAKNEKYRIAVFTDITCGYCRRLHSQMAQYNDLGITIDYLAFPRGGLQSQSYDDMVSVWCADNPQQALTDAKNDKNIAAKTCADNKVKEEYEFGAQIGINGTPALVLEDGTLIPGYQTPQQLLAVLEKSQ